MTQSYSANDVLQIVCEGTSEERPWAMIRHYLVTAVSGPAALEDALIAHFDTNILPAMAALLVDQWDAECISILRVAPQPHNVRFEPLNPVIVGAIATDATPNDNALLIRLSTDEPGPRNRGRVFVPGLPEASTNGGLLLATSAAAWDAVGAMFTTVITVGGDSLTPVIFSRTSYGTDPPGHPASVTDYTSVVTDGSVVGNLASQRRRRIKRNVFG